MKIDCPPGTAWAGPDGPGDVQLSVNRRVEGGCARPDGTRHGPAIVWHANGSRAAAGEYQDGARSGQWRFWHENGQVKGCGRFRSDKPDGEWTTWHDNGQRESEGTYADGVHEGDFVYWARDGRKINKLHFKQGTLLSTEWLSQGEAEK